MDRFIKTLGVLIVMLFLLATGIDATLDRLAHAPHQSQFAIYNSRNTEVAVYTGDVKSFAELAKGNPAQMPKLLRRTKTPGLIPVSTESDYRWL